MYWNAVTDRVAYFCHMIQFKTERESSLTSSGREVKANPSSITVLFFTDVFFFFFNQYFYIDATIH